MSPHPASRRNGWQWFEAALCWAAILTGVGLRVFRFWEPSLWVDELATAHIASAPDLATLLDRGRLSYDPPLHHLIARFFLMLGRNEFFLRLPAVLFGLGSIVAVMLCLRRVAGGRGALFAGALFALNSRSILHSQDARMYGLALFLAAVSVDSFLRVLEDGRPRWLAVYAASTTLLGYNHLFYIAVFGAQLATALGFRVLAREQPGGLPRLLRIQVLVLLLYLPLAPAFRAVHGARTAFAGWTAYPDLAWFRDLVDWPEVSWAVVTAPGLVFLWRRREQLRPQGPAQAGLVSVAFLLLAAWPAAVVAARLNVVNVLQARYFLFALLGLFLLAGFCTAKTNEPLLRIGLCAYLGVCMYFQILIAVTFGPWVGILPKQDWRAASRWIEERYRPDDVVLLRSGLGPVKTWPPTEPGVQAFLSAPLSVYTRTGLTVFNLPWEARELAASPYTPADVRDRARSAATVFVLVNPLRDTWAWDSVESWLGEPDRPAQAVEKQNFQGLQLRVYRGRGNAAVSYNSRYADHFPAPHGHRAGTAPGPTDPGTAPGPSRPVGRLPDLQP